MMSNEDSGAVIQRLLYVIQTIDEDHVIPNCSSSPRDYEHEQRVVSTSNADRTCLQQTI